MSKRKMMTRADKFCARFAYLYCKICFGMRIRHTFFCEDIRRLLRFDGFWYFRFNSYGGETLSCV